MEMAERLRGPDKDEMEGPKFDEETDRCVSV